MDQSITSKLQNSSFSVQNFLEFISLGRILDTAVGNFMSLAFTALVASLVSDVFTPIVSGLVSKDIRKGYFLLRAGPKHPYKTMEEAEMDDGAVVIRYGKLVHASFQFVINALVMYFALKGMFMAKRVIQTGIITKEAKAA